MSWVRRILGGRGRPLPSRTLEERAGVAFGDSVRIRDAGAAVQRGLGGLTGTVAGLTTPSLGYARDVVGDPVDDVAINVLFPDTTTAWFGRELVERIGPTPGLTAAVGDAKFELTANGEWRRVDASQREDPRP